VIEQSSDATRKLPSCLQRLQLAGCDVSPFCVGMVRSPDAIPAAFDHGINFFFLSGDLHWPLYEPTREGLRRLLSRGSDIRSQIVVAVASYVSQPVFALSPFRELLLEIPALERIDLVVAGGCYADDFLRKIAAYRKIGIPAHVGSRAMGASFHDRECALGAVNAAAVDIAFIRYNVLHPGAQRDFFPKLVRDRRTLIYNFKSTLGYREPAAYQARKLNKDLWLPDVTDYYRFALSRPEIDGLLCSPAEPSEVDALCRALSKGPLQPDEEEHMISLAEWQA
jgi:hypothetical protein